MTQSNSGSLLGVELGVAHGWDGVSHIDVQDEIGDGWGDVSMAPALVDEVSRQRRLVVRGEAGIPVAAVIAIGGALLIHAMLVGIFLASFYLVARTPPGMGGVRDGDSERGGSAAGYMFMGDTGEKDAAVKTAVAEVKPAPPAPPLVIEKPPVMSPLAPPQQLALNQVPPVMDPSIIGVPSGEEMLGNVHPIKAQPPVEPPPPIPPVGLPIAAPSQVAILATPVHGAAAPTVVASIVGKGKTGAAGPGVEEGGDDDEGTISLLSSGAGGDERGSGKHRGNGIDRGIFDGQKEPAVLDAPAFNLWADYVYHPPKKAVSLTVKVLASGKVASITISQSCGIAEIDEAYKGHVMRNYRFSPAYRGGSPSDGVIECSQSFSPDEQ